MDEQDTVPKTEFTKRINAKNAKIDSLQEELKALKEANGQLQSAAKAANPEKYEKRISRLMQERDGARDELEQFKTKAGTERAMLTAGVTDAEDQELLQWRYSRLPEAGRPTLGDWLAGAAKEDRQVAHLFGGGEGEPQEPPKRGLPNVNGKTKPPAKPPASASLQAVLAMSPKERLTPEGRALVQQALDSGA